MNIPKTMHDEYPNRLSWLDISKGVAIIMMVIGHTSIPDALSRFIWSFHMPLFFIASGWVTNWWKYSISAFIVRKLKSIMLPFALYSTIVLSVFYFTTSVSFESWIRFGWQGYALWFIPVLFLSSIIGRFTHSIKNRYVRYVIMLFLLFVGSYLSYHDCVLTWNLSSVPYACFLVLLGTELRRLSPWIDKPRWWIACAGLALTVIISHFYWLDICCNHISPVFPLTFGAISGTLMVFTISSYIAHYTKFCSRIVQAIGRETYIVVAFSQITIIIANTYWTHNIILKYTLLIVVLVIMTYLKNCINKMANMKIL